LIISLYFKTPVSDINNTQITRLSFILHLLDIAERRAFEMGQKGKALDWSFRKGDTPMEDGSG